MKVNFLCIGVQKSGTSSLKKYLNLHPDVYCKGECHFFDSDNQQLTREDFENYEKNFTENKKLIGEKTPSYCYIRKAIIRIKEYNPNMKLIMILREPISRAYSQWNVRHKKKFINENFEETIEKDIIPLGRIKKNGENLVVRGFYDDQINFILNLFNKNQLYIAIAEEIKKNKEVEYNKIFNFLGVRKIKIEQNLDTAVGKYENKISKKAEQKLYNIYKPHNENLYKILGRRVKIWEEYYKNI